MIIYISVFIISLLLIYFSFNFKGKIKYIILTAGLCLPCLLAGLRDISIGSDTIGYIFGLYDLSKYYNNMINYLNEMTAHYDISDNLYLILTFVCAKIFNNFNIFLFIYELFIIIPVYKSITLYTKDKRNIIIAMFLFYAFWYNVTLNMARQSIAIAFSLLSLAYINKGNTMKGIVFNLIAIGFHSTAIINFAIIIAYLVLNNRKMNAKKIGSIIIYISFISIIIVSMFTTIMETNIMQEKFQHFKLYFKNMEFDFSYLDTFIYIFVLAILVMKKKSLISNNISYPFTILLGMESLIFLQLGAFIPYAERLSYYAFYPLIINILPVFNFNTHGKKRKKEYTFLFLILGVFCMYWVFVFGFLGMHNTIPFKFYFN